MIKHQGESRFASYETSSGDMHYLVDYRTQEEGAKHFR